MGASSHVAIFSHLSQDGSVLQDESSTEPEEGPAGTSLAAGPLLGAEAETQAAKVAECLRHLLTSFRPAPGPCHFVAGHRGQACAG